MSGAIKRLGAKPIFVDVDNNGNLGPLSVGLNPDAVLYANLFGNLADYVWHLSDGSTLYSNTINDAICKSVGYMLLTVDPDQDDGMGEVVIQQPEPFDIYIDPKSRDMLFKDAAYVMIRKVLPKNHLMNFLILFYYFYHSLRHTYQLMMA